MSSLTNFGELLAMAYLAGDVNSITNASRFATAPAKVSSGIYISLANLDPTLPNGEQGFVDVLSYNSNVQGYSRQVAIFAQPSYPANSTAVEATNTTAITFGPAIGAWPSFTHICINYILLNNTEMVYYELPAPVTVGNMETYTIPIGALKVAFNPPPALTSFNTPARRVALDKLLGIVDANSAARATAFGFRTGSASETVSVFAVLGTAESIPVSDTVETSEGLNSDGFTNIYIVTAQPISFNFNGINTGAYTGETRIASMNQVNFVYPEAGFTETLTVTHLMLVLFAGSQSPIIATTPLAEPRTFSPSDSIRFIVGSVTIGFE